MIEILVAISIIGLCYGLIRLKYGKEKVQYKFLLENGSVIKTTFKNHDIEESESLINIVQNPGDTTHVTLTTHEGAITVLPYDVIEKCVFQILTKTRIL